MLLLRHGDIFAERAGLFTYPAASKGGATSLQRFGLDPVVFQTLFSTLALSESPEPYRSKLRAFAHWAYHVLLLSGSPCDDPADLEAITLSNSVVYAAAQEYELSRRVNERVARQVEACFPKQLMADFEQCCEDYRTDRDIHGSFDVDDPFNEFPALRSGQSMRECYTTITLGMVYRIVQARLNQLNGFRRLRLITDDEYNLFIDRLTSTTPINPGGSLFD